MSAIAMLYALTFAGDMEAIFPISAVRRDHFPDHHYGDGQHRDRLFAAASIILVTSISEIEGIYGPADSITASTNSISCHGTPILVLEA